MKRRTTLLLATVALAAACGRSPTASGARVAPGPSSDGTNYNGSGNLTGGTTGSGNDASLRGLGHVSARFDGTNYGGSGNAAPIDTTGRSGIGFGGGH